MTARLIEVLGECRAKFEFYAKEHKEKARRWREQAATVPATRTSDNFKLADEYREAAKASDQKAKVNLEMVAMIDDALSGAVDDGK